MKYSKSDLIFLPLGGSGEIGMNCNLFHYNDSWLMVDLGVTFSDNESSHYELIMPNIDFIIDKINKLSGIILTHAHEDHIGAMPYLYQYLKKTPIYTTPFTASVLKRKFESQGIFDYEIKLLEYDRSQLIGSFEVKIFCMTHSIPESNAIFLKTKKGNIFHSGDWKIDSSPLVGESISESKIKNFVENNVDVMICDSTNVFNIEPSGSEGEVRESLKKIFSNKEKGKIIVTCFASNIARLETILKVSTELEKYCLLMGRSLHRIYESAKENNFLNQFSNVISEKQAALVPEENLVIICTGSQGEKRAALSRLVNDENKFFNLCENDTVIFSSREIPGNEKKINEVKSVILKKRCELLDHNNSMVHVSGHPSKNELRQMYDWISPDLLIPVHGEYRHLDEHIKFSKECGIRNQILVENGNLINLNKDQKTNVMHNVISGKKVLRGNKVIPIEDKYLKNLDSISTKGEIFINIIMNTEDTIMADPIIFCPSLLLEEEKIEEIKNVIKEEIYNYSNKYVDDEVFRHELKIKVRGFLKSEIGLKPLTIIEIVRI